MECEHELLNRILCVRYFHTKPVSTGVVKTAQKQSTENEDLMHMRAVFYRKLLWEGKLAAPHKSKSQLYRLYFELKQQLWNTEVESQSRIVHIYLDLCITDGDS